MKKKLCSLFLALSMACSASAALAAELTVSDPANTDTAISVSAPDDSQDPEAYSSQHPEKDKIVSKTKTSSSAIKTFSGVRALKSIYTGYNYTVPADADVQHGIDVSKWDKTINWTQVKNSGTDFAIIRCGYRGYGNGAMYSDVNYTTNIKNANAAGVPVGVYFYSQAKTEEEARAEAQYCLNAVKGYSVTYPIVMDVEYAEDSSGYTGRLYKAKLSRAKLTSICMAFCDEIKSAGYTPMIYANTYMLNNKMNPSTISAKYDVWIANYTTTTSYKGDYTYWQYSERGRVSGISTYVDSNFYFGGAKELVACTGVSLAKTEISATEGETISLTATKQPSNTTDSTSWTSSNEDVAEVSEDGTVEAVGAGTAVITAAAGSYSASCTVTVAPEQASITKLKVTSEGYELSFGSESADSYIVYRSETGADGSFVQIGTSEDGTFTDPSGLSGGKYFYYVVGVETNSGVTYTGAASNIARSDYLPQKSVLKTLTKYKTRQVRLTWDYTYGASSYYVYRSTSPNGVYKLVNKIVDKTTYTSSNLTVGRTYYFCIRPFITVNDVKYVGAASSPLSITR